MFTITQNPMPVDNFKKVHLGKAKGNVLRFCVVDFPICLASDYISFYNLWLQKIVVLTLIVELHLASTFVLNRTNPLNKNIRELMTTALCIYF